MQLGEPIDSNQIRQGLLNIKNSQIQLLKELRSEHQILKKYSPPFEIKEQDQSQHERQSHFVLASFEKPKPDSLNFKRASSNNYSNSSGSTKNDHQTINQVYTPFKTQQRKIFKNEQQDNQFQVRQNDNLAEIALLKKQNLLLNDDYQKIKRNYYLEKQKIKDLQECFDFNAKMHLVIQKQLIVGSHPDQIRSKILRDVRNFQAEYPQFRRQSLEEALSLADKKHNHQFPASKTEVDDQKIYLGKQIEELKAQVCQLIKSSYEKSRQVHVESVQMKNILEQLKQKDDQLLKRGNQIENLLKKQSKLELECKETGIQVEQERNQAKKLMNRLQTLQKMRIDIFKKQQKAKEKIRQYEYKIANLESSLVQKNKLEDLNRQSLRKISEVNKSIIQQNQKIKNQNRLFNERLSQYSRKVQIRENNNENELRKVLDNRQRACKMLQAEVASLKGHLSELRRSYEQVMKCQQGNKATELSLKQIYQKRIFALRTNTTIDHLWQVKEVQYHNLNDLLSRFHKQR